MKQIIKESVIGAMYLFFSSMFLATLVIAIYKASGK
jgi:hypothetical protein